LELQNPFLAAVSAIIASVIFWYNAPAMKYKTSASYKHYNRKKTMRLLSFVILFSLITSCSTSNMDVAEIEAKLTTYRNALTEFSGALKTELKAAMKEGGPINAIEVCHTKAPKISTEMTEKAGFQISRTSLKPRNANSTPDEWEKSVLEQFEQRKASGTDPKALEFHQIVQNNGQRQLRYMKAIRTSGVCLDCHGDNIAPDVQAKLEKLYPNDQATGFQAGDLRGAFTITETLP
jgi:hypothetical protein